MEATLKLLEDAAKHGHLLSLLKLWNLTEFAKRQPLQFQAVKR